MSTRKSARSLLMILAITLLSACGYKADLSLPDAKSDTKTATEQNENIDKEKSKEKQSKKTENGTSR